MKRFARNVRNKTNEEEGVLKTLTTGNMEVMRLWIIYEQAVLMKNDNFEKLKHLLDIYGDGIVKSEDPGPRT